MKAKNNMQTLFYNMVKVLIIRCLLKEEKKKEGGSPSKDRQNFRSGSSTSKIPEARPMTLEIRGFDMFLMAKILVDIPETKLELCPSYAFTFDLVSIFTLCAILTSQRFNSPKLDFITIVSVWFWIL